MAIPLQGDGPMSSFAVFPIRVDVVRAEPLVVTSAQAAEILGLKDKRAFQAVVKLHGWKPVHLSKGRKGWRMADLEEWVKVLPADWRDLPPP
jgi:predicted DNA-binding transcriptional regulator AlpA